MFSYISPLREVSEADASLTEEKPNEFVKSQAPCWIDSSAIQLLQSVLLPTHFKDQQVTFHHFLTSPSFGKNLATGGLRSYFDKPRTSPHFIYDKFRASTKTRWQNAILLSWWDSVHKVFSHVRVMFPMQVQPATIAYLFNLAWSLIFIKLRLLIFIMFNLQYSCSLVQCTVKKVPQRKLSINKKTSYENRNAKPEEERMETEWRKK